MNKPIAIFGPYPPPLGGISTHIQRMESYLQQENIDYVIYDHYSTKKENVIPTYKNPLRYLRFLFNRKHSVFHFHHAFFSEYIFYYLFGLFNKTPFIISIHGESFFKYSRLQQKIALYCLKRTKYSKLISVSKKHNEYLNKNGISSIFLPAYVPPYEVNFQKIDFPDNRKVFVFSVWKLTPKLAEEVYNIPLVFNFLSRNKKEYLMLFLIGSEEHSDKKYLESQLRKYNISDDVLILYNKNLIDYLQNGEFLLRANSVDGYGVSLQEALDIGVPAIASDVCERPKGTLLFADNDLDDLTEKINSINRLSDKLFSERENLTYHLELLKIYEKIIKS